MVCLGPTKVAETNPGAANLFDSSVAIFRVTSEAASVLQNLLSIEPAVKAIEDILLAHADRVLLQNITSFAVFVESALASEAHNVEVLFDHNIVGDPGDAERFDFRRACQDFFKEGRKVQVAGGLFDAKDVCAAAVLFPAVQFAVKIHMGSQSLVEVKDERFGGQIKQEETRLAFAAKVLFCGGSTLPIVDAFVQAARFLREVDLKRIDHIFDHAVEVVAKGLGQIITALKNEHSACMQALSAIARADPLDTLDTHLSAETWSSEAILETVGSEQALTLFRAFNSHARYSDDYAEAIARLTNCLSVDSPISTADLRSMCADSKERFDKEYKDDLGFAGGRLGTLTALQAIYRELAPGEVRASLLSKCTAGLERKPLLTPSNARVLAALKGALDGVA